MWREIAGVLLVALALAGCGAGEDAERAATRVAVERAPELLGPADAYRAEVVGAGRDGVERITLTGVAARPDAVLMLDPLTLTLSGVHLRHRPTRVTGVDRASFSARIGEAAANDAVRARLRVGPTTVKNTRIEFGRAQVTVSAALSVMNLVDVPVSTTGELRAQDGVRVVYEPRTLRVIGVGIPPLLVQRLVAEHVNPIADLSALRFTPTIERITVEPGALTLTGTARLRVPWE